MAKDIFKLKNLFSIQDLVNARVHMGHKESLLNGHMRPYIFGKRYGALVMDMDKTQELLYKALNFTAEIAYREGIILFVNRSKQTGRMVEKTAKECGEYAYCRRWRNQVFTNSKELFGAVTRLPDLVLFFNTFNTSTLPHKGVIMAAKMLIPTVGICDTNSDPTLITYPVPGNDDTPESIELYCNLFKTAILNGKSLRAEVIEQHGLEHYHKTLDEV